MKNTKLYKILVNGRSAHGGDLEWDLPKKVKGKWIPGRWHTVKKAIKICESGLHLTTKPFKWYKWGCACYEAEAKGIKEWQDDKCVAESARLTKYIPHPRWWLAAEKFVNSEIKNINWLKPDGKPLKKWKVFYGNSWNVAWGAARGAAGGVARDAAWGAAWDAAWGAAGGVAWDAAWGAAWDAAWGAAGGVARDAAWGAALYAITEFVCEGLKLSKKHIKHARERMKVWRKGYALFGDVNGVLYVYAKR